MHSKQIGNQYRCSSTLVHVLRESTPVGFTDELEPTSLPFANVGPMSPTLPARADAALAGLTPGYFALVMATGILSVGTELTGHHALSMTLLGLCIAAFVTLLSLTIVRTIRHRGEVVADFLDPGRAFGFFTYGAGTNVLGTKLAGAGYHHITLVFLAVTLSAWLIFGYVIPWTAVLGKSERPVIRHANGT